MSFAPRLMPKSNHPSTLGEPRHGLLCPRILCVGPATPPGLQPTFLSARQLHRYPHLIVLGRRAFVLGVGTIFSSDMVAGAFDTSTRV